jgi:hypothetical protein
MCTASAAYSAGSPSRGGLGTLAASDALTFSGIAISSGVAMMPGAMVLTRMPSAARSLAMGRVMPTTPPLLAE